MQVLENLMEEADFIYFFAESVYLEYARYLRNIGLRKQALDYCDKGGKNGVLLRKEFEILDHDTNDGALMKPSSV